MKKTYLVAVVVGLALLVGVFCFVYFQQTGNFMATITQSTSSLLSFNQATTSVASNSVPTASAATQSNSPSAVQTTKISPTTPTTSAKPKITKFEPVAATVGSSVTIVGTGFDKTMNFITFGTSQGRHHSDGTADNVIATVASPDGKTLTFTVPTSGASGLLCDAQNHCIGVSAIRIVPGSYPVTVQNKFGVSQIVTFTVIAS